MPDEDTPIEEGANDAALVEDETTDAAAEAPEEAPAAPTFTPEDDAQDLGSQYQRFAENHDDPRTARREYGKHVDQIQSALGRIHRGIEPTPEDLESLEALGYEMPEPAVEEVEPLWGAPWAEPTTYDEIAQLATQDPARAMEFIDRQPEGRIDPAFRQQVLAWWANPEGGGDAVGMTAYLAQFSETRAETRAREAMEQMREEIRAEFGDVRAKHNDDIVEALHNKETLMTTRAKAEIPNFKEHAAGVEEIMKENIALDPDYAAKLFALDVDDQLRHISDLTGVAAWRATVRAAAEAPAQQEAADAAKVAAGSERGRGAASTSGEGQSAMKKKFTEDIRKALESPA